MKSLLFGGLVLSALLTAAAATAAQSVAAPPQRATPLPKVVIPQATEEITVSASRLGRVVRNFVDIATMPSPIGQVSRWKTYICPKTTGMRPAFTDFVTKHLRETGRDIGAPVHPDEACKPNLQVIFTEHPQEMLDTIRTKLPALLGFHYVPQAKELATVAHPIQAWYATASRDRAGQLMVDTPYELNTARVEGSRLLTGLRSEFIAVTVVVDLVVIENQEIGAIADHIAMLAFSQARAFERCREVASITNMLIDCAPEFKAVALTRYDRAYLKALYAITDRDTKSHLLAGDIAFAMRRILADEN
jgi:hypothetical protein